MASKINIVSYLFLEYIRFNMVDLDFKLSEKMKNIDMNYNYTENIFQVNNFKLSKNPREYKQLLCTIYEFCDKEDIQWVDIYAIKLQNDKCVKRLLRKEGFTILIENKDTISARKQID